MHGSNRIDKPLLKTSSTPASQLYEHKTRPELPNSIRNTGTLSSLPPWQTLSPRNLGRSTPSRLWSSCLSPLATIPPQPLIMEGMSWTLVKRPSICHFTSTAINAITCTSTSGWECTRIPSYSPSLSVTTVITKLLALDGMRPSHPLVRRRHNPSRPAIVDLGGRRIYKFAPMRISPMVDSVT